MWESASMRRRIDSCCAWRSEAIAMSSRAILMSSIVLNSL